MQFRQWRRIEWRKEGGPDASAECLNRAEISRARRSKKKKAEMIDVSETARICRERYAFPLSFFFFFSCLPPCLSRSSRAARSPSGFCAAPDTLAKFIGPPRRKWRFPIHDDVERVRFFPSLLLSSLIFARGDAITRTRAFGGAHERYSFPLARNYVHLVRN